jgi:hypothetical protein
MKVGAKSRLHRNFYKNAMGVSGIKPGMGVMDGRKTRAPK